MECLKRSGATKSGPRSRPTPGIAAAFVLALLCVSLTARAQSASEYQVKAAYLYNFAKLATGPAESRANDSGPLLIGVVAGDDEFVDVLAKTVEGKSVAGRALAVKRANNEDELKGCRVVFVRESAGHKRTDAAIAAGTAGGALLVGEDEEFLQQGGMINLLLQNGRIRFAVNRDALDQAQIHLSPELLQLVTADDAPRKTKAHGARPLRESAPPDYPEIARRLKLKGTVHVEADVRRDGTVKGVRVLGGHPVLAEALSIAVMHWKYEPAAEETVEKVNYTF